MAKNSNVEGSIDKNNPLWQEVFVKDANTRDGEGKNGLSGIDYV